MVYNMFLILNIYWLTFTKFFMVVISVTVFENVNIEETFRQLSIAQTLVAFQVKEFKANLKDKLLTNLVLCLLIGYQTKNNKI